MATIKIISNPYQKNIKYQRLDQDKSEWVDINVSTQKGSNLLKKEFTDGFFPFYVKDILSTIVDEFDLPNEALQVQFEGSDDEYAELQEAVSVLLEDGVQVVPSKTDIYLENARDILPDVRVLFQEMSPLILSSISKEKIQRDLGRFSDASSDVVPICVLGNYSTGKSTFINALIGSEVLPSGSEPVTAKIYKISKSRYPDRASVRFKYFDNDIVISFSNNRTQIEKGIDCNPLAATIRGATSLLEKESISNRVNKTLSIINTYESSSEANSISDLIEVDIPFLNGVMANSPHPFVLFDTPGSNSASNAKHLAVLKQAMSNMTNGLPIFLCTPDSLDSTDNENLYQIIHNMEELDSRFTMIVVNKADSAGVQRRTSNAADEQRVLSQAVPRNLYSGGLFYVSSILGLGAKNNGDFIDIDYDDIYEAQVTRYQDAKNKHYRQLYLYNIMPEQIKRRANELASAQENMIYANSGFFTVENEIESFAGKYAAYNKCYQSQMFLRKVIQATESEIENKRKTNEEIRQSIVDKLEEDKKNLIEEIKRRASEEQGRFDEEYSGHMSELLKQAEDTFCFDELLKKETEITHGQEKSQGYDGATADIRKSWEVLPEKVIKSVHENVDAKTNIRSFVQAVQDGFENVADSYKTQYKIKQQVDRATADELLKYVSEQFDFRLSEFYNRLDEQSRSYWSENTEKLRRELAFVVSGTNALPDDRRQELERIIITYKKLSFDDSHTKRLFSKGKFEKQIKIGNQVIWKSDRLDIGKLTNTYNTHMREGTYERYRSIEKSHRESAHSWIDSLRIEILNNIVDYSPVLSNQANQVRVMDNAIKELIETRKQLEEYTQKLCSMMDWKNV